MRYFPFFLFMLLCSFIISCAEPSSSNNPLKSSDYQIELHMDTIWIYDGDRLVGSHVDTAARHGQWIDSLILNDNL
jgi:hypothetical protein